MKFAADERVLCHTMNLLYEAKITKVETRGPKTEDGNDRPEEEQGPYYYVHYKGWKSSWDEWQPEHNVLKFTDENVKTAQDLKKAQAALKKKPEKKDKGTPAPGEKRAGDDATPATASRSQKRSRVDVELEKEEDYMKKPEVRIHVPDTLKALLVDDWENITKNQQLVTLPRSPTVTEIINQYREQATKKRAGSAEADIFEEVLGGIKLYFDRCLGSILLYRFERQQYVDIKKNSGDQEMSDVYGAEHLLRLFVSLPELMAHTNMDAQSVQVLKDYIEDFLKFLAKDQSNFFLQTYENATPNYQSLAKVV
ncbi:MRG-domain-containing protein [Saitoella complicata NRRL Y-17804]|uniref:Chromatin modification-related protein EAF3 n=1 Tax=Saitoella complicata (strain BCRC 22490 / CBS 7301 / JCM 7358 / NBRC 10748 / NRRL Y-17804) TaxID=698492 RepID=A0A0E9NMB1_SAICN|nr:MRG-domain-containing protein [Saitoella complicata NRRL Y-17804]ODQ56358.1 MRG-domain-containing protein [Saitoella complicata NRRL Y-17804]GAO50836.1 hypothetical protein G7K_4956-t1 [Saitoella complicata NRRL Y-17804]